MNDRLSNSSEVDIWIIHTILDVYYMKIINTSFGHGLYVCIRNERTLLGYINDYCKLICRGCKGRLLALFKTQFVLLPLCFQQVVVSCQQRYHCKQMWISNPRS